MSVMDFTVYFTTASFCAKGISQADMFPCQFGAARKPELSSQRVTLVVCRNGRKIMMKVIPMGKIKENFL